MTGALPPRDRGHRGGDPCGASGPRRVMPSARGLVEGVAADQKGKGRVKCHPTCRTTIATIGPLLAHVRAGRSVWPCSPHQREDGPQSKKARRGRSRAGVPRESGLRRETVASAAGKLPMKIADVP